MAKVSIEIDELKNIDRTLEGKEQGFVRAAVQEYKDMMSGEKVFSRASDIREYRLLLLIENVFGEMPSEKVVANLFQLKNSEARTLMKNVDAKYRRRIANKKNSSLLEFIKGIDTTSGDSNLQFDCDSVYKIDSLNDLISSDCEIIQKVPNKMNRYTINANTLIYLRSILEK